MLSKYFRRLAVVLAFLWAGSELAEASTGKGITMLVVPARYSVLQVSFDIVRQYSVILVSYQGDASSDSPLIHAWNGREWVPVTVSDYRNATFLQMRPSQTILVGDEKLLPSVMGAISAWCPRLVVIPEIDTASLVNQLGRLFRFGRREWEWYSARYNLQLQDLNEDRRRTSWYDGHYVAPGRRGSLESEMPAAEVVEPALSTPMPSVAVEYRGVTEATPAAGSVAPIGWEEKAVATDITE